MQTHPAELQKCMLFIYIPIDSLFIHVFYIQNLFYYCASLCLQAVTLGYIEHHHTAIAEYCNHIELP